MVTQPEMMTPPLLLLVENLLLWVDQERLSPHPMELHGPQGVREHQSISMELLTETVLSWQ